MRSGTKLADEALQELYARASEKRREGMSRYFTTSMAMIGVGVPQIRILARKYARILRNDPKSVVLEFSKGLLASEKFEARGLVYEVVSRHEGVMSNLQVREVEELGKGNDNWGSVDAFATLVTGRLWLSGILKDRTLHRWVRSKDVWLRRTAVVSSVPLNLRSKGGSGDADRTLGIIEAVKQERHPMVAKAVSWALRSLTVWEPDTVRQFLDGNASLLPSLVLREVRRKLDTGRKNRKTGRLAGCSAGCCNQLES